MTSLSVVIPVRNGGRCVERCITSVLSQGRDVPEIIVVDDGSTDRTVDVVKDTFGTGVRLFSIPPSGAPFARNYGMARSRGAYCIFLDADDYIEEGYVDQIRDAVGSSGQADIILGGYRKLTIKGLGEPVAYMTSRIDCLLSLYLSELLQTGAITWSRRFLDSLGGWDESLEAFQDIDLFIRACARNPKWEIANKLTSFVIYDQVSSHTRISAASSVPKSLSILSVIMRAERIAAAQDNTPLKRIVGSYYHGLALRCYAARQDGIGVFCSSRASFLGFRSEGRSRVGQLLDGLVGQRVKVKMRCTLERLNFCRRM